MTATVRGISSGGSEGGINERGQREYTVVYKVSTDDRSDGPQAVRTAFGIPNTGDSYIRGNDVDFPAIVVGKSVTQVDAFEWEVTCNYSTINDDDPTGFRPEAIDNPLQEPAEVSYGFQSRRILIPGSYNDPIGPPSDKGWEQGIFAPNGELFDPQPEAEISEPVLRIKRNVAASEFVAADLMALANCVNFDVFMGAEARQLKLSAPEAERRFHKNIGFYWTLNYAIAFRWETWDIQILNQGHYYWPSGKPSGVWGTTQLPSVKRLLSGDVRLINLTIDGKENTSDTPTFTRIRFYREINFSALNLI